MKLFPAIDILNGRAVRLLYGKKELVTDYGLPLDRAKLWRDAGADFLHVVDLCGAFEGESRIDGEIEKIAALGVKVQSGGGLRTMEEIERRLNAGASRVVLGTVCHTNPALFREAVEKYGDKIVAGIDCKDGFLSVKGWTETSGKRAFPSANAPKRWAFVTASLRTCRGTARCPASPSKKRRNSAWKRA